MGKEVDGVLSWSLVRWFSDRSRGWSSVMMMVEASICLMGCGRNLEAEMVMFAWLVGGMLQMAEVWRAKRVQLKLVAENSDTVFAVDLRQLKEYSLA